MNLEGMTLVELLLHFFKGSKVVNGGTVTASIGREHSVPVETSGGEGYTEWVKATTWEDIRCQPVVVVKVSSCVDTNHFASGKFILTHDTYKLIHALIKGEIEATNITNGKSSNKQAMKGGCINVVLDGTSSTKQAIAWGRVSPGRVKSFEIKGTLYAINLATPTIISETTIVSEESPGNSIDPKRVIQWLPFGTLSEALSRKAL